MFFYIQLKYNLSFPDSHLKFETCYLDPPQNFTQSGHLKFVLLN